MSGVFGIVDTRRSGDLAPLMAKMARAMSHFDWYVAEYFQSEANLAALGRIGIGIFNPQLQPIQNADCSVALSMAGEIYAVSGHLRPPGTTDEQWALQLYEQYGEQFARKINGAFVIALWDYRLKRLVLTNDRFGFYNLFYTVYNDRLVFGPEMKAILCDPQFPRRLDIAALAQYMRFQQVLGERTFFEDIQLLPSASVLTFEARSGALQVRPYWTYADIPYRPEVTLPEAAEEAGRLLRNAVQRFSSDGYKPGVFLSGGLDARTIIGLVERRPIPSLTFGVSNCRDVVYAQSIARAVGSEHHWVEFKDGNWVRQHADVHLELTEGYHSWIHMHGISALPLARQVMQVNLSGWDGGSVMGYVDSHDPYRYDPSSEEAALCYQFYLFNQKYTWPGLSEAEERVLYTDSLSRRILGLAFDSFQYEFDRFADFRRDTRHDHFFLAQQCRRSTQNMVVFGRSHIEQRFPFWDYDVYDFVFSLPATMRKELKLYRTLIQNETPRLASIPYDYDDLPPTLNSWRYGFKAWEKRLKNAIHSHVLPIFPGYATLYADYENYLRHELRRWAEKILFDRRTADHGIFRPSAVEALFKLHLSGQQPWTIGKIAPIMTYEMMLRRFYD